MPVSLRSMTLRKRTNLLLSGLNLLFRRTQPWSLPLHMQFELANYCNLRCPVCPTGAHDLRRPPKAMAPALFERVMDEVGPCLLTASLWGWGESLLNPHLAQILAIANRHPVVTFLSTNGQNLDRDSIVDAILSAPPSYLIVALDGLTDETNSQFRVGARLAPALEGVRRIAALKKERNQRFPILHMRFMVMRHNEHEFEAAPEFAERHGFDMFSSRMLCLVESSPAREAHASLMPIREDFRAGRLAEAKPDFICMQPFWFPSVYSDGTVVLCEQDSEGIAPAGVVGPDLRFSQVWRSIRAAGLRKTIRDNPSALPFCASCPECDRAATNSSVSATFFNAGLADPLVLGP